MSRYNDYWVHPSIPFSARLHSELKGRLGLIKLPNPLSATYIVVPLPAPSPTNHVVLLDSGPGPGAGLGASVSPATPHAQRQGLLLDLVTEHAGRVVRGNTIGRGQVVVRADWLETCLAAGRVLGPEEGCGGWEIRCTTDPEYAPSGTMLGAAHGVAGGEGGRSDAASAVLRINKHYQPRKAAAFRYPPPTDTRLARSIDASATAYSKAFPALAPPSAASGSGPASLVSPAGRIWSDSDPDSHSDADADADADSNADTTHPAQPRPTAQRKRARSPTSRSPSPSIAPRPKHSTLPPGFVRNCRPYQDATEWRIKAEEPPSNVDSRGPSRSPARQASPSVPASLNAHSSTVPSPPLPAPPRRAGTSGLGAWFDAPPVPRAVPKPIIRLKESSLSSALVLPFGTLDEEAKQSTVSWDVEVVFSDDEENDETHDAEERSLVARQAQTPGPSGSSLSRLDAIELDNAPCGAHRVHVPPRVDRAASVSTIMDPGVGVEEDEPHGTGRELQLSGHTLPTSMSSATGPMAGKVSPSGQAVSTPAQLIPVPISPLALAETSALASPRGNAREQGLLPSTKADLAHSAPAYEQEDNDAPSSASRTCARPASPPAAPLHPDWQLALHAMTDEDLLAVDYMIRRLREWMKDEDEDKDKAEVKGGGGNGRDGSGRDVGFASDTGAGSGFGTGVGQLVVRRIKNKVDLEADSEALRRFLASLNDEVDIPTDSADMTADGGNTLPERSAQVGDGWVDSTDYPRVYATHADLVCGILGVPIVSAGG